MTNRAGQDMACSAEPDRGGKGSVRQRRARQDRVDPGWVGQDRMGRVVWDRTGSCKAGHDWVGPSSVGYGREGQRQADWTRAAPAKTGQGRA